MTVQYLIADNDEFAGATIFLDGDEPLTIASSHPDYARIVQELLSGDPDEELIKTLSAPAQAVSEALIRLSRRFTYRNGAIFFDGDTLDNALTEHIVKIIEQGADREQDYKNFVAFAEKLYNNPSKKSRKHLFAFIQNHGISIAEDGDFVAFKGVSSNGKSTRSGYGIVDGVEFKNDHLQNNIGSIIEIPRSMVDDDRSVACSVGLHVGSYGYASSFAAKLLRVKVNPADVVSVPSDHQDAKIRVSRYEVIEENGEDYTAPSYTVIGVVLPPVAADPDDSEDDGDTELSDDEVYELRKIDEFVALIPTLSQSELRRHRNRKVTAKGRPAFDLAMKKLGLSY